MVSDCWSGPRVEVLVFTLFSQGPEDEVERSRCFEPKESLLLFEFASQEVPAGQMRICPEAESVWTLSGALVEVRLEALGNAVCRRSTREPTAGRAPSLPESRASAAASRIGARTVPTGISNARSAVSWGINP